MTATPRGKGTSGCWKSEEKRKEKKEGKGEKESGGVLYVGQGQIGLRPCAQTDRGSNGTREKEKRNKGGPKEKKGLEKKRYWHFTSGIVTVGCFHSCREKLPVV